MEQILSWEALSRSACAGIRRLLWNTKVHNLFTCSRDGIQSWVSWVQSLSAFISPCTTRHPSSWFPATVFLCISHFHQELFMAYPFHHPWFNRPDSSLICWSSFSLYNFLHSPVSSSSPQRSLFRHLQFIFLLWSENKLLKNQEVKL
jgi:hypothetical protein